MNTMQAQPSITVRELQQRLSEPFPHRLLDVRTSPEFASAHIPGATLVPLDQLDFAAIRQLSADGKCVYVLCQSGGRARKAIQKFETAGINNCVLVEGGMEAWLNAGLPVQRGETRVLPLMRQVQIAVGLIAGTGAILALTINPLFAIIPLFMSCGLVFAGVTGICGLAILLAKMPWNRGNGCGSCCEPKKEQTI
ncbi:MAG: rhodanese-like domain-containing protein [Limisphaerales bacterium]